MHRKPLFPAKSTRSDSPRTTSRSTSRPRSAPKPEWDSSVSDLTKHRATPDQLIQRRLSAMPAEKLISILKSVATAVPRTTASPQVSSSTEVSQTSVKGTPLKAKVPQTEIIDLSDDEVESFLDQHRDVFPQSSSSSGSDLFAEPLTRSFSNLPEANFSSSQVPEPVIPASPQRPRLINSSISQPLAQPLFSSVSAQYVPPQTDIKDTSFNVTLDDTMYPIDRNSEQIEALRKENIELKVRELVLGAINLIHS